MKKALKALERGTPFTFAGQRWIALEDVYKRQGLRNPRRTSRFC